jgi:hypothetical protein
MVAHTMPIVTVAVRLIATTTVFPIARTAARTTLDATNSKRQHQSLLTF